MERREFLRAGAAAGAVVATSGCAATAMRAPSPAETPATLPISPDETAYLTGRIDGVLGAMDHASLVDEIIPGDLPVPRDDADQMAAVEQLLQNGVRSLYLSGIYLDQAPSMRAEPELQKRVIDNLPAMDRTVRQSSAALASLTQADQSRFQQTLREHPEIGMRVAEVLDRRAGELGISSRRRMQLRLAAAQVTTRMRNQHPGVVAEEYLHKTNKAYVRHGGPELVRRVAARAGEQMFWAPMVAAAGAAPLEPYAPSTAPAPGPAPASPTSARPAIVDPVSGAPAYGGPAYGGPAPAPPAQQGQPGARALSAAGWMFGIGIGSFAAGLVIVELGAFPGVFLMTAGVVLFIIAVITALVGLIIRASNR